MNHTSYKCKLCRRIQDLFIHTHTQKHIDHIPNTFLNFIDIFGTFPVIQMINLRNNILMSPRIRQ